MLPSHSKEKTGLTVQYYVSRYRPNTGVDTGPRPLLDEDVGFRPSTEKDGASTTDLPSRHEVTLIIK